MKKTEQEKRTYVGQHKAAVVSVPRIMPAPGFAPGRFPV